MAAGRGVEVVWAFCESHASDIPFQVVTRLLRAGMGVTDLDGEAARARVREQVRDADAQDLLLLDDLLGIADPDLALPKIDPDARRRRLTTLVNATTLARTEPALFIIEDAHWVDAVSESMLSEFLTVIPRTPSMVLITSRPEYQGALMRAHGAQTIALAPLDDSDTAALLGELVGSDPSVAELAAIIADRAAGNPFFTEEMVRELAQRGVLTGERGDYLCRADVAERQRAGHGAGGHRGAHRPAGHPGQAHVERRVGDRRPLRAELLAALGIDAVVDELLGAKLIDQVRFTPSAEYAFRHPLIRAVAYESQLKSDRAQWHRRLAAAIQERAPGSVEENAALIAEHLEAAGELHAAYGWHMRAGAWSTIRDIDAARLSWERARRIADALPADDPDQLSMRIAPRTMLCATGGLARAVQEGRGRFAELRELCNAAGDKVSLAIGMSGPAAELLTPGVRARGRGWYPNRWRCSSRSAIPPRPWGWRSERSAPGSMPVNSARSCGGRRPSSTWPPATPPRAPASVSGSPLAVGLAFRGSARWWLGRPGWRQDLHDAVAMARHSNPRQPSPASSPGPTVARCSTGCFGPMTPRCARSRRRCRPPREPAMLSH